MRPSILICAVLSLSGKIAVSVHADSRAEQVEYGTGTTAVSAGPILRNRQEGETTTIANNDGGESSTVVDNNDTGSSTSPAGSSPSPPTSPPGSSPSPIVETPNPDDACPPCSKEGHVTFTSRSGKVCYCIGGETEPWEWSDKKCINDVEGLPNDEGRPSLCLGSGGTPASRACPSNCNFMLNTVNSLNPCNENLYNAAQSCGSCVPGGALRFQPDGKSPGGPYINRDTIGTFMDGLKNWCARPNRCIDLTTGGKISGTGGCPVVVQNNPGTPSVGGGSTTIRSGGGSSTTVPSGGSSTTMRSNGGQTTISNQPSSSTSLNGASSIARPGNGTPTVVRGGGGGSTTIPSRIVTTSTISTTDEQGRPTFSLALATVDNPDFTGNSEFADVRPTTASDGGGASSRTGLSLSSLFIAGIMTLAIFA